MNKSDQVFQQMLAAIEGLSDQALSDPARYLPWMEAQSINPADFFGHFHTGKGFLHIGGYGLASAKEE